MKLRYPNTSILSLSTQEVNGKEQILFLYLKPVPEFLSGTSVYWYSNRGRQGEAKVIWPALGIRQWVAAGQDAIISDLYEQLLRDRQLTIESKVLYLPAYTVQKGPSDHSDASEQETLSIVDLPGIPQAFFQQENLQLLSGYGGVSTEITPAFPVGFYEENFIWRKLNAGIFGVREFRTPFATLRGLRSTMVAGKGSVDILGFYQTPIEEEQRWEVAVSRADSTKMATAPIDPASGRFELLLPEPVATGELTINRSSATERVIPFTLLQGVNFQVNASASSFKDQYGREFILTPGGGTRPTEAPKPFSWLQSIYAREQDAGKVLSDQFKRLIDYLGPKILVVDPYFLGAIAHDTTTNVFTTSLCQNAFLNALLHSAFETKIEELAILGNTARANTHYPATGSTTVTKTGDRFNIYQQYLSQLLSGKIQRYLPAGTIAFYNSQEDIHNRYLISMAGDSTSRKLEKVVLVSTSLGAMFEVDFNPVTDEDQWLQLVRKFARIFQLAELKLTI